MTKMMRIYLLRERNMRINRFLVCTFFNLPQFRWLCVLLFYVLIFFLPTNPSLSNNVFHIQYISANIFASRTSNLLKIIDDPTKSD